MAEFLKKLRTKWESPALLPLRAAVYGGMLFLIAVYFESGGAFIYEAF